MTLTSRIDDDLRAKIIAQPSVILDDPDVMRALIAANDEAIGGNVIDLRGIAMERLETRLDRLEDTHRSVIAAAYENLAGTNQVHRAILRMLDPLGFEDFLDNLSGEVAAILRVDTVRLVLEAGDPGTEGLTRRLGHVLSLVPPGGVMQHVGAGENVGPRQVTLRQIEAGSEAIYGSEGAQMRSEACLLLDFGIEGKPALLVLGAVDPYMFSPRQGSDLLAFFAGVFERAMRRWLA